MAERRRVLVTNDDGIDSEGIRVLSHTAASLGLAVTVAAPSWDASGSSASVAAAAQPGGRIGVRERRLDGVVAAGYSVEAAPAFIVRAAVDGMFGPPPDLVLSGINHGLNTGQSIIHSGTVGAALTARLHGVPGAAFSFGIGPAPAAGGPPATTDGPDPEAHWDTAAFVARTVIGWLLSAAGPVTLNVNIPNVAGEALRGLRPARLAPVGTAQTTVTDAASGRRRVHPEPPATSAGAPGAGPTGPGEVDTDLVSAGVACFTPLQPVCEDGGFDPASLS